MPIIITLLTLGLIAMYLACLLGFMRIPGCILLALVPLTMLFYILLFIGQLNMLGSYAPYLSVVGLSRSQVIQQLGEPSWIMQEGTQFPTRVRPRPQRLPSGQIWSYCTGLRISSQVVYLFFDDKKRVETVFWAVSY